MSADDIVSTLRDSLAGEVIDPASPEYEQARRVWNGTIDRHPAAVVRVEGVDDVVTVVRTAREKQLLLAVRCGGHSMPGLSTCDGGIVLDLSRMRGVEVDPEARVAVAQGGSLLGDLDRATLPHGLATPTGTVSHTGIGGLTLGGGFGRLARKHGLTADNLRAVELVTADGKLVRASDEENPDLFWAVRGAGANFGVVTSFEFRLHPQEEVSFAALAVHPLEAVGDVLRFYAEYAPAAPDEQVTIASLQTIGADGPFPPALHGTKAIVMAASYCGDSQEAAERSVEPLRGFGSPLFDAFLPAPYAFFQTMMDAHWSPGRRAYVKGAYLDEIGAPAIDAIAGCFEQVPSTGTELGLISLGGAISRLPEDATAFTGRDAVAYIGFETVWDDPEGDQAHAGWTKGSHKAVEPHFGHGNYINAVDTDAEDAVRAAYGEEKYKRLVELKTTWDPDNLFRLNQNIRPR